MTMQLYPSGTRIANRYEVAGRPLVGGMGIVYLCFDHQEQRPVALKTFRPEFLPDRAARDRFLEEGNTWVRLGKHPHIVRCYQVFQDRPRPEVYLALELVGKEEGRRDASLRAWLTPGRPLPVDEALLIALQVARGMRHAAETIPGFVHRDLKPENVLVGADRLSNVAINRVRVTDFGLVKGLRAEQLAAAGAIDLATAAARLTRVGALVGTPLYMAPEQWVSAAVGVPADIYALGCMVGEMVTGRMLVQGATLDALRRAHQNGQAWTGAQAVPAVLHRLLQGCLAVEPGRRYAGWDAVEAAVEAAYRGVTQQLAPGPEAAAALSRAERVAAGWSASAMGVSYLQMGNAQAALDYFQRARQAGQIEGERLLEEAGLGHLGEACRYLGDARQASGYCEQALAIAREIGDHMGEGTALGNLGSAYLQLGDAWRAIGCYEQALTIARKVGDRIGEGNALGNLGIVYWQLGDARQAIGYFGKALVIWREIGDRRNEGTDLGNVGNAYLQLGDARRASGYYEQALAISREIGDRHGESTWLGQFGIACTNLGDAQRAIDYIEQALAIAREIGDRRGEGSDLGKLGSAYAVLGDARRAVQYYEQALAIRREIGDRHGEGIALGNLGCAYAELGDAQRAIGYFEQALAIRREIGDQHGVGNDLDNLGSAYGDLGDAQRAIEYLEQALAIRREIGDRGGEGNALGNLGRIYLRLGDAQRAIEYLEQALAIRREIGDSRGEAYDTFNMAVLYTQQGDRARALPLAGKAGRLWSQMGHAAYAQRARQLVAQLGGYGGSP